MYKMRTLLYPAPQRYSAYGLVTDVLVDISGWFTKSGGSGSLFTAQEAPVRILRHPGPGTRRACRAGRPSATGPVTRVRRLGTAARR